jgi:hypothetical protein
MDPGTNPCMGVVTIPEFAIFLILDFHQMGMIPRRIIFKNLIHTLFSGLIPLSPLSRERGGNQKGGESGFQPEHSFPHCWKKDQAFHTGHSNQQCY